MVVVGTSGFMYKNWRGIFYPDGLPISSFLSYYARFFKGVEINSTFYRLPLKSTISAYKKVSINYVFKLYRGITHFHKLEDEFIKPFIMVKEVLKDNLSGFLAQFSEKFRPTDRNKEYLLRVIEVFKDVAPIFVELRAKEWEDSLEFLKENRVCVVFADFPPFLNWFSKGVATESNAYFRFHGREALYKGLYKDEELKEFADRIKSINSKNKFAFFNNTTAGAAPLNAIKLQEFLQD